MTKKVTKAAEAKTEVKPAAEVKSAAAKPAKGAKAATKKDAAAPAKKEAKAKVEKAPKAAAAPKETKADKARVIYARLKGQPRKDVVAAFQAEIGLSAAASATYFQNIKASLAKATA